MLGKASGLMQGHLLAYQALMSNPLTTDRALQMKPLVVTHHQMAQDTYINRLRGNA